MEKIKLPQAEPSQQKIRRSKAISWAGKRAFSLREKKAFYQLMARLLAAGLSLMDGLGILESQNNGARQQRLILQIQDALAAGQSLSESLQAHPQHFSQLEWSSIQMGEESGQLAAVMTHLEDYFGRRLLLRQKIKQALSYPVTVMCIAMLVIAFMLRFVVPMFADIFRQFDAELPALTQWVLGLSRALGDYIGYMLGAVLLTFVVVRQFLATEPGKRMAAAFLLGIPILGSLVQKIQLSRFFENLAFLIQAHIPLDRSLQLMTGMHTFPPLKDACMRLHQAIVQGHSLMEALKGESFFPPYVQPFIKVGEESAQLGGMIEKLSEKLTEESNARLQSLSSFVEPMLISFLGLVVALILISMYLPMFQMSQVMGI